MGMTLAALEATGEWTRVEVGGCWRCGAALLWRRWRSYWEGTCIACARWGSLVRLPERVPQPVKVETSCVDCAVGCVVSASELDSKRPVRCVACGIEYRAKWDVGGKEERGRVAEYWRARRVIG